MKIIYIKQGLKERKRVHRVFVDDEDYEWLNDLRGWSVNADGYVQLRKSGNKATGGVAFTRSMARLIMMLPPGLKGGHDLTVDHIDGDPLNNQKENLRVCTIQENIQNPNTFNTQKTIRSIAKGWHKVYRMP